MVSLHVDGRPGNAGLFGAEQFAMMKPRSLFINASRGMVVDDVALRENILSGPHRRRRARRLPGRAEGPGRRVRVARCAASTTSSSPRTSAAPPRRRRRRSATSCPASSPASPSRAARRCRSTCRSAGPARWPRPGWASCTATCPACWPRSTCARRPGRQRHRAVPGHPRRAGYVVTDVAERLSETALESSATTSTRSGCAPGTPDRPAAASRLRSGTPARRDGHQQQPETQHQPVGTRTSGPPKNCGR